MYVTITQPGAAAGVGLLPLGFGGFRDNPYIHGVTETAPPPSRARVPVCTLGPEHRAAIERHLLALGERDRYLRFGYAAQDAQIRRYVEGLRFGTDEIFGIFNRRLQLIAMAHLAYGLAHDRSDTAEFGVSVSPHARGRGYGNQLFDRAVVHARNHGVSLLHIHALSENAAMLGIARKAGAEIVREGGESECRLALPPADFESHVTELLEEQVARTQYRVKAHTQQVRRWLGRLLCWRRRPGA